MTLDEGMLEERRRRRAKSLLGQLYGRPVRAHLLQQRLPTVWRCRAAVEVLELQNHFFLFTFTLESNMIRARRLSPWTVAGQKLVATNWTLNFDQTKAYIACLPVWIELPGLRIKLWAKDHIKKIVAPMGRFLGLDMATRSEGRRSLNASSVRAQLKIDLDQKN